MNVEIKKTSNVDLLYSDVKRHHIDIKQNETFEVQNLVSFRKYVLMNELQAQMVELQNYVQACGASKVGGIISATYAVNGNKMDIEVYVPVDKEVPATREFTFKPRLYLTNCIKTTYKGNPSLLDTTMVVLNKFLADNDLMPISVGFIVTVRDVSNVDELDLYEADLYISVNPNVM